VDAFLEQVANVVESLQRNHKGMQEEVRRLELEIQGYRKREETFKRALLNSQKVLDQMKDNARKSAELIIAEAEVKAEKILNNAHNRLAQLHEDISELKRQRTQIEVQIGSIVEAHSKLLELSKEGAKAMDEEDAKLKLLKQAK
jgi:cell division initiation protein